MNYLNAWKSRRSLSVIEHTCSYFSFASSMQDQPIFIRVLFTGILFTLYCFVLPYPSNSNESQSGKNFWDNHSIFFPILMFFAPYLTILSATSVKLTLYSLVYACVPDFAIPMLAIERGYHNSNPYLFYSFLLFVFFKNCVFCFIGTPTTLNPTRTITPLVVNHNYGFVYDIRNLVNLLSDIQMIFRADDKKLNQLSIDQLLCLREEFSRKIAKIDHSISIKKDNQPKKNFYENCDKEKCIICYAETAIIRQSPCRHILMCYKCFEELKDNQKRLFSGFAEFLNISQLIYPLCPSCRFPIISYNIEGRVSIEQYELESKTETMQEISNLREYVRSNPNILSRLRSNTAKLFSWP